MAASQCVDKLCTASLVEINPAAPCKAFCTFVRACQPRLKRQSAGKYNINVADALAVFNAVVPSSLRQRAKDTFGYLLGW